MDVVISVRIETAVHQKVLIPKTKDIVHRDGKTFSTTIEGISADHSSLKRGESNKQITTYLSVSIANIQLLEQELNEGNCAHRNCSQTSTYHLEYRID